MGALTDYLEQVRPMIKDDAKKLTDDQAKEIIKNAVKDFSKDQPLELVKKYDGDGTKYDFDLPSDWKVGFSLVKEVEFPTGIRPAEFLTEFDDWTIYQAETKKQFRFVSVTPATGQSALVSFTALHTVNDVDPTTIPTVDEGAFFNLAASKCCRALQAYFANSMDGTLGADVVDHAARSDYYSTLAEAYMEEYNKHIGKEAESKKPAGKLKDYDLPPQWGADRLFHPKRYR